MISVSVCLFGGTTFQLDITFESESSDEFSSDTETLLGIGVREIENFPSVKEQWG